MTRTVLVPFDGSAQARAALRYACALAPDERVVALHVVGPIADADAAAYERAFETARDCLAAARELAGDGAFEAAFVYGHPLHEILHYVERYVVDQVVMGSYGRDEADELRLGSVAESVVRRSPVPVTVVRESRTTERGVSLPEGVLVPFDGSVPSREALAYAFERFPDATPTVLYARYPTTDTTDEWRTLADADTAFADWHDGVRAWHAEADRDAERVLHIADHVADRHDREFRRETVAGEPERVVVEAVEREGVDHVVVGSHGRDGVTRGLLGSVAGFVARRAPVSVTVVR